MNKVLSDLQQSVVLVNRLLKRDYGCKPQLQDLTNEHAALPWFEFSWL